MDFLRKNLYQVVTINSKQLDVYKEILTEMIVTLLPNRVVQIMINTGWRKKTGLVTFGFGI